MTTLLFGTIDSAGACANTPGVADPVRRTNVSDRICSVDGCETSLYCKGLCVKHYARQRAGKPLVRPSFCSVDGCTSPPSGKGWCKIHYGRWYRTGNPLGRPQMSVEQRVWGKATRDAVTGCWLHSHRSNGHMGYRQVNIAGLPTLAHRASWELANGPIPDDIKVLHRCDTPACVNPGHLFLGTDLDNARDRDSKGRHRPLRGEANGSSKLTDDQVRDIRSSYVPRKVGYRDLAKRHGVSQGTIGFILKGETWAHVEASA